MSNDYKVDASKKTRDNFRLPERVNPADAKALQEKLGANHRVVVKEDSHTVQVLDYMRG